MNRLIATWHSYILFMAAGMLNPLKKAFLTDPLIVLIRLTQI